MPGKRLKNGHLWMLYSIAIAQGFCGGICQSVLEIGTTPIVAGADGLKAAFRKRFSSD